MGANHKWVRALREGWNRPAVRTFRAQVLVPYLVHRTFLVLVVAMTTSVLRMDRLVRALPGNPIADPWVRWDSMHYLNVAMNGYGPLPDAQQNGFFPLYPFLVSIVGDVMPLPWAALLVSNISSIAALELLRRLALHHGDEAFAKRVVWIALLFPSSYCFTAAYSESTFLLVTIGAVLAWQEKHARWAGACAALAVLARPIGAACVIGPFFLGMILRRNDARPSMAVISGGLVGLATLLVIYEVQTGDPLAFLHASGVQNLRLFWADESPPPILELLQDEGFGRNLMQRLLNWSSVLLGLTAAVVLAIRKRWELAGICAVALAIPLYFHHSLIDLSSMSRYLLGAFPLFLVLAKWFPENERSSRLYDAGSQMLQLALAAFFASGRWLE